jgi:hypothetical protein
VSAQHLGASAALGDILFVPIEKTKLRPDLEDTPKFGQLVVHTKYYPSRFPTHRDFLDKHDFQLWLNGVLTPR